MNVFLIPLACLLAAAAGYWSLGRGTPRPAGTWATAWLLASFSLALLFYLPVLGHATGAAGPRITRLLSNCAVLSAATSALAVSFQINFEPGEARRRVRLHLVLLGLAIAGMTALFAYEQMAHRAPYAYALYLLLFVSYLGLAAINLLQQVTRHARSTRSRSVRVGMRMVATGCACVVLYLGHKCTILVTLCLDVHFEAVRSERSWPVDPPRLFSATFPVLGAVLICLGFTLPAVAYQIGQIRRHRWETRSLAVLGPLWHDLSRALPEIVLPTGPDPEPDFLLHRRVIEIDDAVLALRPYRSRSVEEAAQHIAPATKQGTAIVEAAVIADALVSFRAGRPAAEVAPPSSAELASRKDLRTDTQWLLRVADAYGRRPAPNC